MTADITAIVAASAPSTEVAISHENPAANALLIANRSNGDLDDHTLRNLLRRGYARCVMVLSFSIKIFVSPWMKS